MFGGGPSSTSSTASVEPVSVLSAGSGACSVVLVSSGVDSSGSAVLVPVAAPVGSVESDSPSLPESGSGAGDGAASESRLSPASESVTSPPQAAAIRVVQISRTSAMRSR